MIKMIMSKKEIQTVNNLAEKGEMAIITYDGQTYLMCPRWLAEKAGAI